MAEAVKDKVEDVVKNRAKFEYAILGVITFFVSNYYFTGIEPGDNMIDIFQLCIIAYLIIFGLDIIAPILTKAIGVYNAEHPPMWVTVALDSVVVMQKFVERLPNVICPYAKVPEETEDPKPTKGDLAWK